MGVVRCSNKGDNRSDRAIIVTAANVRRKVNEELGGTEPIS